MPCRLDRQEDYEFRNGDVFQYGPDEYLYAGMCRIRISDNLIGPADRGDWASYRNGEVGPGGAMSDSSVRWQLRNRGGRIIQRGPQVVVVDQVLDWELEQLLEGF